MAQASNLKRDVLVMNLEQELESQTQSGYGKSISACSNEELYYSILQLSKKLMTASERIEGEKKIYYISAEFLIGKLLSNNLINLGIYDNLEKILEKNGKQLSAIEEVEPEPSLGNGGLGRLAACFLDSIASLGLPGEGIGLNYHFGLFKQEFKDKLQTAEKNDWIEDQSWLTKTDTTFEVAFGKRKVASRLYDIDVIGYDNGVNKLRLFDIETIDESLVKKGIDFDKENIEKNLTLFLYPDDSDEAGNLLRIYQQYFMVSNAAQLILKEMKEKQYDLRKMYDHAVIQINDTHPTMVIPELIRILVDEKAFTMDEAIEVVSRTCAYTNHTILAEALEKWPLAYLEKVVPQLVPIIKELDKRVAKKYKDPKVQIIDEDDRVHMAHIDIHYGFSVNGVAAIHTEILKNTELNAFYKIYPEKFNNKTNGITFRRWLLSCNHELACFLSETIGDGYKKDAANLEKLLEFADDETALNRIAEIKMNRKKDLAAYVQKVEGVTLNPDSIFDIQSKRLHEYKRQQMNALYIIHKYLEIKAGKKPARPMTFIFGAKAAPAYVIAQDIIHLLLVLQEIVNVEIHELVGDDNIYIFGEKSETVIEHYEKADYVSKDYYKKSPIIKEAVDFIVSKEALKVGHKENLERLYKELLNKDWFMTLLDLEDYIKTKDQMMADYEDQRKWRKMMLVNIAKAGFFSSDRTIEEYNRDIWKLR